MTTALRFALRELRAGLSGFRILIACLALGVAAIAAVGTVRSGIENGLNREGAIMLGGDAEAEFTYRRADADERAWLDVQSVALSEVIDFRSMLVVQKGDQKERGLTQIKAIDTAYPLFGQLRLQTGADIATALAAHDGRPSVVVETVLAEQLGVSIGDVVILGTKEFTLSDVITYIPDSAGDGFGLGPRTIVYAADLDGSGLLGEGTLFSTKYRMVLPQGSDLAAFADTAKAQFEGAGVRWRDATNAAPGVERFVDRLGSFLILVGLAGLATGGIGVSAAVRSYLERKVSVIATLRSLGAENAVIFQTYFIQIGVLSILGIAIGLALGIGVPLMAEPLIAASLPFPINLSVYPQPVFEAVIYGALTAVIFTLWPLSRAENIKAATLFRNMVDAGPMMPRWPYIVAIVVLIAVLLGMAVWFTGSVRLTLWTAVGIFGALGILFFTAMLVRWGARALIQMSRGRPRLRWALSAMGGQNEGAASVILAIGLGLSVLAAMGQIDGNLRRAIAQDLPGVAPAYFFIDIQKSQMPAFRTMLQTNPQVTKFDEAPMLRGIVSKINDVPALEVAPDHWVIRGDRGLTYASKLPPRYDVVQGEWWPETYDGPPLISFAKDEALEIGLAIGDRITVNILGREITGTISNFRDVDFSTAGIGFVMTFNEAALSKAPHTFIATVYSDPASEAQLLRDIADAFPNITAIRIRDAIERVSNVMGSIASAVAYGAGATLLTGFLVLVGSAASSQHNRAFEAAVLKTLGATRSQILTSFAARSAMMGAAAGSVAIVVGIIGGWAINHYVMEADFAVIWSNAVAVVFGGIVANLLANIGFALKALNAAPAQILRTRE
jgi:putative ABC transport system permease protein